MVAPVAVSFRREKYIPKGGPDGGDGGRGGDVVFKATTKKRTLYHLQFNKHYKAKNGAGGQGKNRAGKGGDDLFIELPAGTLVIDADTGTLLKDLVTPDEVFVVQKVVAGDLATRGSSPPPTEPPDSHNPESRANP